MCISGLERPGHSGRNEAHPEVVQGEVSEHRWGDVRREHVEEEENGVSSSRLGGIARATLRIASSLQW